MHYLMEAEYFSSHPVYAGRIVEAEMIKKHHSVLFGDVYEFVTNEIHHKHERVLLSPSALKTLIPSGVYDEC